MKVPDKIYIAWEYSQIDVLPPGVTSKKVFGKDVEFIREDALLEWASDRLGKVSDMGFDDGDVEHGYIRALQDVIDKIQSL